MTIHNLTASILRRAAVVATLAAGFMNASTDAQCTTLVAGTNVDISRRTGNESEAAIAIDPTNPLRMFALSNVDSGNFLMGSYSTNGGATWTTRNLATGGDGLAAACCDGSCAFDSFGNLFICYLTAAGTNAVIGLSTNGGVSFTTAATLSSVNDQPTLTTGPGSVWVCYKATAGINARGAAVTGLGVVGAFTAAQTAPTSSSGNFGDICVGPAGQVAVCYQNNTGGQGFSTIFVNVDTNGLTAGGFGAQITATTCNVGGFDYIPAQATRSVDSESGLAWDRSGGPRNGYLYLVYTDEVPDESNNMDIYVRRSTNNGTTWSAPVKVNDDTTTRSQFLPRIAVDQSTGNIAVTWHDSRNSAGNNTAQMFGTVSTDGGVTFMPNVLISAGFANSNTAGNGIDFGDYSGLSFVNNKFYPVWADNSGAVTGNPNVPKLDILTAGVTLTNLTPAAPTAAFASNPAICPGGSSQLFATVPSGQTIDWYAGGCASGGVIGTGSGITVTPAVTTTYFGRARTTSGGCTGTACASVTVSVGAAPTITTQPSPVTVAAGDPAVFTVAASGPGVSGTLSYQWRMGGVTLVDGGAIAGSTTNTLTISPTVITDNGEPFDCVVTNTCGGVPSDAVVLTVNCLPAQMPAISVHPASSDTCNPNTATFSVVASGALLSYQWQFEPVPGSNQWESIMDGFDPDLGATGGASTATLTASPNVGMTTAEGSLRCLISSPCGTVISQTARLFIGASDLGVQGGGFGSDTVYDNNDFVAFIEAFFTMNPIADIGVQGGDLGSDGVLDNNDFVVFIEHFFNHAGCP